MRKDLTLVLMTCGELTEKSCINAVLPFRRHIAVKTVRNVYPQIKALNKMIDLVETDYFIPLDADIVLNRNAWVRISAALDKYRSDTYWHTILFPLWDTLTKRKILALKLMRTKVMKRNRFIDSPTPDIEHFQRLTSLGYMCVQDYLKEWPIGRHIVRGKRFCYHKLRDLYQTYQAHGWEWDKGAFLGGKDVYERAAAHFNFFMYRWVLTGKEDYLWCIAGMMDGILSPVEKKSKDLQQKCTMSMEAGVHLFVDWYWKHASEPPPIPPPAYYLF